jgi:hypothetical protein
MHFEYNILHNKMDADKSMEKEAVCVQCLAPETFDVHTKKSYAERGRYLFLITLLTIWIIFLIVIICALFMYKILHTDAVLLFQIRFKHK